MRIGAFIALAVLYLQAGRASAAEKIDFSRDVLPILSANCFKCHGPDQNARKAKLRLDTKDGALRANDPIIVPGKSAESELVRRTSSVKDDVRMPPPSANRKLTAQQIEVLRRWIDEGAAWGRHWAYLAPVRPQVPPVRDPKALVRNPIDNFVLARLEREGLLASPEAAKELLLRRVTLDLTGLPPTPVEADAFLADKAPNAYEKVVDRLLASPRYGERMAWDWLDAARYADTSGYQGDPERTMWPWRDWVVKALNDNMPYDCFTIEQLAGDLLPNATADQKIATGFNRNHMHNGEGGRIGEETRVENVMDRVETTATVWMGATVGCARCHDHKFDPFTQREYYQLFAYFNNSSENGGGRAGQSAPVIEVAGDDDKARLAAQGKRVEEVGAEVAAVENKLFPGLRAKKPVVPDAIAKLPKTILDALKRAPDQRTSVQLREIIGRFQKSDPAYAKVLTRLDQAVVERDRLSKAMPRVMIMDELPKPRETFILVRGAYNKPGDAVTIGVPACLPPLPTDAPKNRLALAQWLVSPAHPLTARVTVNRYWQTFFGAGLVKTVEDFGKQGEQPSHAELLDWLATEFVGTHWDVKGMHRLIVTSATYRQSSQFRISDCGFRIEDNHAMAAAVGGALVFNPKSEIRNSKWEDPDNRLLARGPRFRLPSWMIRDQALAASGLLVAKLGGPGVKPYQPAGVWEEATFGFKTYQQDKGEGLYRRSLYTFWRRIIGPTSFFDTASRQTCTVKVVRTNTPLHALATLNDTTYVEAARVLAQRVLEKGGEPEQRIEAAFRLVVARAPTSEEKRILLGSLERLRVVYTADADAATRLLKVGESPRNEKLDAREHAAWTALCTMLLNLDETLTRQ
jgi:hypothetical protein